MPSLHHRARHRLAAEEHRFEVDRQHAVEILLGEIEEFAGMRDAGVVDEDVDAAVPGERMLDQRVDVGLARDVGADEALRRRSTRRPRFPPSPRDRRARASRLRSRNAARRRSRCRARRRSRSRCGPAVVRLRHGDTSESRRRQWYAPAGASRECGRIGPSGNASVVARIGLRSVVYNSIPANRPSADCRPAEGLIQSTYTFNIDRYHNNSRKSELHARRGRVELLIINGHAFRDSGGSHLS